MCACFCELQLSRNEDLSISALDLPDFYHTFSVPRARALRNQLAPPRAVTEVEELAAFRRLGAICHHGVATRCRLGASDCVDCGDLAQ